MPRILVLCRRGDATALSDTVTELLSDRYGVKRVVRRTVDRGESERPQAATEELRSYAVVVVVMGRHWLSAGEASGQPLPAPHDDALITSQAAALRLGKLIAPVLSEGVQMPSSAELPSEIQSLTQSQAFPVRAAPYFADDVQRLCGQINTKLTWRPASAVLTALASLAVAMTALTLFCAFVILPSSDAPDDAAIHGSMLSTIALVTVVLIAISAVSSIIAAARRRSRPWLAVLLTGAVVTAVSSQVHTQLQPLPMRIVLTALPAAFMIALPIFALFGPRRETAFR